MRGKFSGKLLFQCQSNNNIIISACSCSSLIQVRDKPDGRRGSNQRAIKGEIWVLLLKMDPVSMWFTYFKAVPLPRGENVPFLGEPDVRSKGVFPERGMEDKSKG